MSTSSFPQGFLWGTATAGHQNEGNNTTSDTWFLENVTPTIFREPSGPACRSWDLWPADLDLVQGMGLNAFRFSIEWARIEPEQGLINEEALAHYGQVIQGCLERGLAPVVTFCHFTAPHWFAARGGWLHEEAADDFAAYCTLITERWGEHFAAAVTLNEPNLELLLTIGGKLPQEALEAKGAMLRAAAEAAGTAIYRTSNVIEDGEMEAFQTAFTKAHKAARAAIKAVRPDLLVGVSIAMADEVALPGGEANRDARRAAVYDHWLEVAKDDDFIGVQNYERILHGPDGEVDAAADLPRNGMGTAVDAASLAGAVRYAHEKSGLPVLVTEHGIATGDDTLREQFIPAALEELAKEVGRGTPVLGYLHWTLLDNFEWIFGYGMQLGLHEVNRETFERTPKPSAAAYAAAVSAYATEVDIIRV